MVLRRATNAVIKHQIAAKYFVKILHSTSYSQLIL